MQFAVLDKRRETVEIRQRTLNHYGECCLQKVLHTFVRSIKITSVYYLKKKENKYGKNKAYVVTLSIHIYILNLIDASTNQYAYF